LDPFLAPGLHSSALHSSSNSNYLYNKTPPLHTNITTSGVTDAGLTMASPTAAKATPKRGPSADNIEGDQRAAKRTKYVPLSEVTGVGRADETARDIEDFDNIITVLVGSEEKRFIIHQDAICDKSKFFKAACSKRWIEGQAKLVRLPEVKPEVFQQYSNWVYSGTITPCRCVDATESNFRVAEQLMFIDLYLLGDSLDDISLRKAATQASLSHLKAGNGIPPPSALAVVWSLTPPKSLFRKLMVDCTIANCEREALGKRIAAYPQEFVQEVAMAALLKCKTTTLEKAIGEGFDYLEPEEQNVKAA
jgi:hypothetical protein